MLDYRVGPGGVKTHTVRSRSFNFRTTPHCSVLHRAGPRAGELESFAIKRGESPAPPFQQRPGPLSPAPFVPVYTAAPPEMCMSHPRAARAARRPPCFPRLCNESSFCFLVMNFNTLPKIVVIKRSDGRYRATAMGPLYPSYSSEWVRRRHV